GSEFLDSSFLAAIFLSSVFLAKLDEEVFRFRFVLFKVLVFD
ncbi:MAG: hypothetical protein ACJAYK_003039, partial [Crocinitomicaceae bacterium]